MKHPITINALRDMMSTRSLHGQQAYTVAEKQAHKFLRLSGCQTPSDITPAIEALPKVKIDIRPNLPVSGAVDWVDGYWQILINADEPPTRQRFSLAHELKHMIDHAFIPIDTTANKAKDDAEPEQNSHHESVCDYFAGCLLVPRPWLKTMLGIRHPRPRPTRNPLRRLPPSHDRPPLPNRTGQPKRTTGLLRPIPTLHGLQPTETSNKTRYLPPSKIPSLART